MQKRLSSRVRAVHIWLMAPLLGLAVFLSVLAAVSAPVARAAASSNLNFQARLLTSGGAIVPDGNYNIDFKLYTADSTTGSVGTCSGACVWEETRKNSNSQGVPVINGYFSVNLGSVTAFGSTINWDQQLWLTMNIGGTTVGASPTWDGEMQNSGHSIALTAVPLAFRANQLALTNGANQGTLSFGSVTNNPVLTLPNESGTLCSTGSVCTGYAPSATNGYVQFAPTAAQADATNNNSIFINKTSGTGNIFELQKSASDVLVLNNIGQLGLGGPAANGLLTVGTNTTTSSGGIYFGTDTNLYRSGSAALTSNSRITAT
ncbi:MAG: hypothetical protein ACRD72_22025, partial [Candidatus Angelobacter sp.]